MHYNLSLFSFPFSSSSARYYNSSLSLWLSVDPLSDKYPNLSPYTYCADNPVRLVDPKGDSLINNYSKMLKDAQEKYDLASLQNVPDISFYKNILDDVKSMHNYVKQFIQALTDEQYATLNNIQDEDGNRIDILIMVDYNLKTVAANKPRWTSDKKLQDGIVCVYINPNRNENNKETNTPMYNWKKVSRHEGGHLYYIIRHHRTYYEWLEQNGIIKDGHIDRNYGGHGRGDESGKYSRIWENGKIEEW